ncbi:MAG TPA: nuclear transport factor 2 family protein [Acidimicrobiia bacterium]|nr:nuclear transport factor 2 family protein [Acidimicrobiia bacterium]
MTPEQTAAVWAEHCRCEFELRDVDATLETMTQDAHLLNIPTGHGGTGQNGVRRFYTDEFIGTFPDDIAVDSLGLTVGDTRIAEEVVMSFTHDREMPWILPGVGPTGRKVVSPMVAVVGFRDGKVRFEHIWWDQAALLAQLGLLDPARLPVVGAEQAPSIANLGDS